MSKRTFEEFFSTHDSIEIRKDTITPAYRRPTPPPPPISKENLLTMPELDYESPIKIIQDKINVQLEDDIYKVVQSYDIKVDKNELIKALNNDRQQYEKGYKDGIRKYVSELKDRLMTDCTVVSEGNWMYGITAKGYDREEATDIIDSLAEEMEGDT